MMLLYLLNKEQSKYEGMKGQSHLRLVLLGGFTWKVGIVSELFTQVHCNPNYQPLIWEGPLFLKL